MEGKTLARIGAAMFAGVAITAAAIEMGRDEGAPVAMPPERVLTAPADPLRAELIRCQLLGEGGPRDSACLRAWAENRRRFLAPGARPMEGLPETAIAGTPDNPIHKETAPITERPAAPLAPSAEAR